MVAPWIKRRRAAVQQESQKKKDAGAEAAAKAIAEHKTIEEFRGELLETIASKPLETPKDIGLSDQDAYDDVKELRGLLDSWRATKTTVGHTIARMLTTSVLTALAIGIYMGWGGE